MRKLDEIAEKLTAMRRGCVVDIGEDGLAFRLGPLRAIASTGGGRDHVSVSTATRIPLYREMVKIKRLCFKPDEWAMELHAPESDHVNIHPFTLHLWRPQVLPVPTPPVIFV